MRANKTLKEDFDLLQEKSKKENGALESMLKDAN